MDRGLRYEHEERENKKLGANLSPSVIRNSFLFFSIFIFPFPLLVPHSRFPIPGSSLSTSNFSKLKSSNKAQDKAINASQNTALKIIFEHSISVEYRIPFIKFDNKSGTCTISPKCIYPNYGCTCDKIQNDSPFSD